MSSYAGTGVARAYRQDRGDKLTWSDKITSPMMPLTLQFEVTFAGDEMSGVVKLGVFGKAIYGHAGVFVPPSEPLRPVTPQFFVDFVCDATRGVAQPAGR